MQFPAISKRLTFLLVTLLVQHSQGQKLSSKYSPKVSVGAFFTEVKGPLLYETFVPLIYEYQVPVLKTLDITLRDWRGKCDNDNYSPSYTCPVFYHYEKFLERFEQEVVPKAWVDPVTNRSTAPSPMVENDDFCNKIQKHFKGSLTQEFGFEEYIEKLKQCLEGLGNLLIDRNIKDYVFETKTLFKKINDNYEKEFSTKFFSETNKNIGPAFYVNSLTGHQNGMLIAYLLEKIRWTSAQASCNEGRAPDTLLRPQNITKNLKDLNNRLSIANLQTAVKVDELSSIFKLPLTDCSFIERTGSFVVRIQIPIIRKDAAPKLFRINTIPFLIDGKMCQLNVKRDQLFIADDKTNSLQFTECTGTQSICQVAEFKNEVTNLCLRSIFAKDHVAAKKYCTGDSFGCVEMPKTKSLLKLPLVQRIYSDAWVVVGTGSAADKLAIKCGGTTEEVDLTQEISGALEIHLPCRCQMVFNSEILLPIKPCSEFIVPAEIRQILLPQFITEDVLTRNSSISLSSFDSNFLKGKADNNEEKNEPFVHTPDSEGQEGTHVKRVDSNEDGPQLGILWALVMLQMILICFILVFGLYRYSKYRQEMRYSKERLVYNIYASPSDTNLPETTSSNAYRVTSAEHSMNNL